VLVDSFEAKAEVIAERGIGFYIDDRPAALRNIPPNGSVLLFWNEGNFGFDERRWGICGQTGKLG